jgi:hypothetical protein
MNADSLPDDDWSSDVHVGLTEDAAANLAAAIAATPDDHPDKAKLSQAPNKILPPAVGTTEGMSTGPERPQHNTPMSRKTTADKAQPDTESALAEVIIAPENEVLILRTCTRNEAGQIVGYGGFPWPETGPVHAPEKWDSSWGEEPDEFLGGFDPDIKCGAGLHGLEEGDFSSDWTLLNWDIDAQAMLVVADKTKIARVSGKVKFQSGIVRKLVSLAEGLCAVFCQRKHIEAEVTRISNEAKKDNDPANPVDTGYDSRLAASGYDSRLAASGYASRLAASGDDSRLAASGNASQLAASGYASRLAASGNDSVAVSAGRCSRAKAGKNGAIALTWHDGSRPRIAVGYVGENGIEADTWYQVNDAGELEKVG